MTTAMNNETAVASSQIRQVMIRQPVKVARYDPEMERLCWAIAEDSTVRNPVYPATVRLVAMTCRRCVLDRDFLAQGRIGDEPLLICTGCGETWTPTWGGHWRLSGDPQAFNRSLLLNAIADAGLGRDPNALEAVTALRADLAAGCWTPSWTDHGFSHQLRVWENETVNVEALRRSMYLEGWRERSPALSEALARAIGLLHLPESEKQGLPASLAQEIVALAWEIERVPREALTGHW
ncbi:hypothetical protein [Kitasatospora cineracea]|uniref:hypothetical protein n=1 Tax=Kitasatospora cineracea TaxID=88074 RepID=UPI0033CF42C0